MNKYADLINTHTPEWARTKNAKNAGINGLLRLANIMLGFFLTIYLARTLGIDGLGTYAFGVGVAFFTSLISRMGLPTVVVRITTSALAQSDWRKLRGVAVFAFISALLASAITISIGIALITLTSTTDTSQIRNAAFLALFISPLLTFNSIIQGFLRSFDRMFFAYSGQFLITQIVTLSSVFYFYSVGDLNAQTALWSFGIGWTVCILFGFTALLIIWPAPFDSTEVETDILSWSRYSLTSSIGANSDLMTGTLDLTLIAIASTPGVVGLYSLVLRICQFISFPTIAIASSLGPQIAQLHTNNHTEVLNRKLRGAVLAGSIIATALFFTSFIVGIVVAWITKIPFETMLSPIIILGLGFLVKTFAGNAGDVLNLTGNAKTAAILTIAAALLSIALIFALTPQLGAAGAAFAIAIFVSGREWALAVFLLRRTNYRSDLINALFSR